MITSSDPTAGIGAQPRPAQRPRLIQLLFGSVLVLTEEVAERVVVDAEEVPYTTRTPESVFRPASEFDQLLGGEQFQKTRYLTIGIAGDARKAAERGLAVVDDITDATGRTFWRFAGPVWESGLLGPVRRPVQRWRKRGESQVEQWIASGMQQEMQSRAIASASLNNLVQESVTDLTNNQEIQVLVQEVIQSQSTSIITQILQEIRERFISMDIWVQGAFGTAQPDPPPFRNAYLRTLILRRPQYEHIDIRNSLAGGYTGFVSRFVATIIDIAILLLVYAIGSAAITGTINLFGLSGIVSRFLASGTLASQITLVFLGLASLLLISGYAILSWYLTGSTIGDSIMGFEVVDLAGGRLSFWRSVRRMIGAVIAAIPLFLGFIWVLFSKNRQGWHDKIGGTYVVYSWPARPEEEFLHEHVAEELAEDALDRH
ncbi:MAG: RDD family protein [Chloroflexota bacterium]